MIVDIMSEEQTKQFAQVIAGNLKCGYLITLDGDLGAGKTFFTGALCEAMGIDRKLVCSPTYTIMRKIKGKSFDIYHWDFYRISSIDELAATDFFELLNDKSSINIIEWASLLKESWYNYYPRIEIEIEIGEKDEQRRIRTEIKS